VGRAEFMPQTHGLDVLAACISEALTSASEDAAEIFSAAFPGL
jgi:hypothetical protein